MADKKPTYARGKNPNSLANLQKGVNYRNRAKASECGKKGVEAKKTKRTMKEIADTMLQEEQKFTLKDGSVVTMTKLEVIVSNYIKACATNPTHKNVLALRSIMGEDIQHIETTIKTDGKYNDVEVTPDMIARAEAIFANLNNGTADKR